MSLKRSQGSGLGGAGDSGGALGSFYSHEIENSLRLTRGASSKLTWTPSSATDSNKIFTVSFWFKRGKLGDSIGHIFNSKNTGSGTGQGFTGIGFADSDELMYFTENGGNNGETNGRFFRDTSTWYHFCWQYDTNQSTEGDRIKFYINGVHFATNSTNWTNTGNTLYPAEDSVMTSVNASGELQQWGEDASAVRSQADGYLAEVYMLDGISTDCDSFGEFKDGVWIPKEYSGSYGTNGYRLEFKQTGTSQNSSGIGADTSGNDNHFAVSNLAASDVVPDTPTKNFATINPLMTNGQVHSGAVYQEGNLKVLGGGFSTSTIGGGFSTIAIPKDKKIYMEFCETDITGDYYSVGIMIQNHVMNSTQTGGNGSVMYSNRSVFINGVETDYGSSAGVGGLGVAKLAAGDVLGVAVDGATGKVWFHRNGTYFKSPSTDNSGTTGNPSAGTNEIATVTNTTAINPTGNLFFAINNHQDSDNAFVNFGQESTFAGEKTAGSETDANGEGKFLYAVPTDYVCLHSGNMSDPAITQADEHFNAVTYTGNGSTQSITGVGHQPDLVWIKNITSSHPNVLTDSVRGVTKEIQSESSTATESTNADGLTAFGADGFSLGDDDYYNYSSNSFVSFNWKAGTTASGTESGSNPAYSSSSNSTAGFSIVAYTGTGSTGTVSHGCGAVPSTILIKNRDVGDNWAVYHAGAASDPETDYLILNTSAAAADSANWWNDTAPTSSVFTVATDHSVNADGEKYIAYVFTPIEGYSAFGAYEGNGDADGTFIYTGFSPRLVITKSVDSTSNWNVHDIARHPINPNDAFTYADTVNIGAGAGTDFLSNGFKHRQSGDSNVSETYVYLAFAEAPFKYANAR